MSGSVLLTGGAGYIGSHTCVELISSGFDVTVFDNFSNSSVKSIGRAEEITGKKINLIEGDIRNAGEVEAALREGRSDAVVHFAGLKSVGESTERPLLYYDNNVNGTLSLLSAMDKVGVRRLIFSSSATVYGEPSYLPIDEAHSLSATNPYGRSKLIVEQMLLDLSSSRPDWAIAILRYFNPVGAHESGKIGEDPKGIPNNLVPFIAQVAAGRHEALKVWGSDYATPDGTGVRDYIHVTDLAIGHVKALEKLENQSLLTVNLGTGVGYSVLDVVRAFEAASGKSIPYELCPRRPGDVASCFANPSAASKLIGWRADRDLSKMCEDHWRWQQGNPKGYT